MPGDHWLQLNMHLGPNFIVVNRPRVDLYGGPFAIYDYVVIMY